MQRSKKQEAYRQFENAAKESINDNPDTYKPKTMDIVLTKIEHLEKQVGELHDHIMPNEKMRWPGMYIAIKELTENIGKLEKMQENEIEKSKKRDEKIESFEHELDIFKDEIHDLKQKVLIKEVEERAVKDDEVKRSKSFELKLKWIAGISAITSLLSWAYNFFK